MPVIWGHGIAVLSVTAALIISRWPAIHLQTAPVSIGNHRRLCGGVFAAGVVGRVVQRCPGIAGIKNVALNSTQPPSPALDRACNDIPTNVAIRIAG
jgi:hypothetical protein